jgi:hypothetical protein
MGKENWGKEMKGLRETGDIETTKNRNTRKD